MLSPSPLRSEAMRLAWAIRKTGQSFSDAIKRAWASLRIKTQKAKQSISFFYTKENGEERYAIANNLLAPPIPANRPAKPARRPGQKEGSPLVIKYYDMLATGWRSFRADRLILC